MRKNVVRNIIENNQLLPEQLKNQPDYQCISAVLLKVVTFDLMRLTRAAGTIFNNNTKACYDRIMPFLSLLFYQHFGLLAEVADFLLHFLHAAEYHVRTCYDTST